MRRPGWDAPGTAAPRRPLTDAGGVRNSDAPPDRDSGLCETWTKHHRGVDRQTMMPRRPISTAMETASTSSRPPPSHDPLAGRDTERSRLAVDRHPGIVGRMRTLLVLAFGFAASPAVSQDLKVLLCTADSQLNLSSDTLDPVPSDETYTWELYYEDGELVSLAAPFDCRDGTEEWTIGTTVISLECQQGIREVTSVRIFAEIDRYAQSFMVSGIGEDLNDPEADAALWVQEGRCELARRKF